MSVKCAENSSLVKEICKVLRCARLAPYSAQDDKEIEEDWKKFPAFAKDAIGWGNAAHRMCATRPTPRFAQDDN
jgi:hypothetical protein